MLARLFVIFGGLLVLALLAALVGPYWIDWSSYRAGFEREASALLGRPVTVKGTASARILPFPSVTFTDVAVGPGGSGAPAMTVETFSMDAELAPLLHGEFLIFDMRLVRPKVTIDVAADGTVDWAARPSAHFDAGRIALEHMTVSDGEVLLRHRASGREHRLTGIEAVLSARSLAGPWRADGTLVADGVRTGVSASTGIAEDGAIRLRLDLAPDGSDMRLTTEGNVQLHGAAADYAGTFRLAEEPPKPTAGEDEPAEGEEEEAPPGVRLSGSFALDHRRLAVDEFRFETGPRDDPYGADGKASLEFGAAPRFSVQAQGEQVRFDRAAGGEGGEGLSFPQRLAVLEEAVRSLPRPGIPGTIDLDLPAVVAGDTTVRDVRLSAEPGSGGWRIKSLAATLPGRATLEADGMLSTGGEFGFKGSLLLAVAQPSGFAAWIARDVDEAVRRLPAAGFSAEVSLTARQQSFHNLELILGDARLKGEVLSSLPDEGRPALDIALSGGKLDLDQLDAFASLFVGADGESRFGGRDVSLALKAGPLSASGFTAKTLDAAMELSDDRLLVDRFALQDLAGADISASGSLSGLRNAPTGALEARVAASDLRPLLARAAARFPRLAALSAFEARAKAFPGLLRGADLAVSMVAEKGEAGARPFSLSVNGVAGGSDFTAKLGGDAGPAAFAEMPLSLDASARNSDGAPLLALAGLQAEALGLTGPAQLSVTMKGAPAAGLATSVALTGEDFAAIFNGNVSAGAGGIALKGPVKLDAEDIEPWMLTLGFGMPGFGLGTPADLQADADYADGLLVLTGLRGGLDEGAVSGDINVALKAGLPDITGALSLDEFDLGRAASIVLGEQVLDEAADGGLTTPFREKPWAPFSAAFDLSAGTLNAGPLGTLYDADLTLSLDAQRIAVGGLTASHAGGRFKGNAELKNSGGTGLLTAQLDLKDARLDAAWTDGGLQAAGDLSASLSASGKSLSGLLASLGGSGTATLRDVAIEGLNADAFQLLLAKADEAGRDVDAAAVARFAAPLAADGSFEAKEADIAFTIAGGVLRAPPVTISNPQASVTANLRADLGAGAVAVNGTLAFVPGADALVGFEPVLGFTLEGPLEQARFRFDSVPFGQFLTQRALEREQARVEGLQSALLEKQRLRRESRYYGWLESDRWRRAEENERRTEAAQIRVNDRAALEAEERRRAAAADKAAEDERRRVEDAIRLAESERAKQQAAQPRPSRPALAAPAPADAFTNLDELLPQLEETQ